ncbi:MAG TPA: hypothetical protein VNL98_11995 [Gemmatimonadales bacterium]|nr:hypothetical protein [Gemmatimonadales bacterium]
MIVRRYVAEDAAAIGRLNARLRAAGVTWPVYPERPEDTAPDSPISSRLFVAAQGSEVRGAVWLREHEFWIEGQAVRAGWIKYPVSESLIDGVFSGVPAALVLHLLREQPRLMALGMGGESGPLARLLRAVRWRGGSVPFYVLVMRPARVLRRLRLLRRTWWARAVTDAIAFTGLGWLGLRMVSRVRRLWHATPPGYTIDVMETFDTWADAVWQQSRTAYSLIARRDAKMLNALYPADSPAVRLRLSNGKSPVGWVCVLQHEFAAADGSPFAGLRVGLIADALSPPAGAPAIIAAAVEYLSRWNLDLIISNQSHSAWGRALLANGFLPGPSQFAFYCAPSVFPTASARHGMAAFHLNRGDCDGPVFW